MQVTLADVRALGRAAAERIIAGRGGALPTGAKDFRAIFEADMRWARTSYLGAAEADLAGDLVRCRDERLASDLDYDRYPECRGLPDLELAKRRAFREMLDDPLAEAYAFDWYFFCSRRLNTRYVGVTPPPAQCTDFWFAESREGGPIHGCNRDDVLFRYRTGFAPPPTGGPADRPFPAPGSGISRIGGVSASVLCDEEPECSFPVTMEWILPKGLTDLREYVAFHARYRDFWGPGNSLLCDEKMNFAALEKANVRLGVRYSEGCAAITACAYVTPEMNAFKRERDALSFAARGWPADNADAAYWAGAERRYRRLLELVQREHQRGATLIGTAGICLDHAVPFPDRVCIAGEKGHPAEPLQNWTIISFATCLAGPNRRTLYWTIDPENPAPIYTTPCHVIPGEGLAARRDEWVAEVAAAGDIGG